MYFRQMTFVVKLMCEGEFFKINEGSALYTNSCHDEMGIDWTQFFCAVGEVVMYICDYRQVGEVSNSSVEWVAILHPIHGPSITMISNLVKIC